MVASCPKCSARYRVDADRIGPDGAKLRCTKCSAVFLVRAPQAPPAPAPAAQPQSQAEPQPDLAAQAEAMQQAAAASQAPVDSARLVLVADPVESRGKATADAIRTWGLTPHLVHDGVEAMLAIQRMLPKAIVLDAALPKMFGFQVCEVVKRNESLRDSTVVLVGAIHHQERYRRNPSELYGADAYVESPDLPDGLLPLLRQAGLEILGDEAGSPPPAPSESPIPREAPSPPSTQESIEEDDASTHSHAHAPTAEITQPAQPAADAPAETPAEEDPERAAERERAQRLARIAVSEMVLYQPEKFDQASREGMLEQALDLEIQEARALLRQRIGEEVRAERDFIIDELNRVAAERSQQG